MATIFASNVMKGDSIKLDNSRGGNNAIVESVQKSGSSVKLVVRDQVTGEKITINAPHSTKLEKTVKVVR